MSEKQIKKKEPQYQPMQKQKIKKARIYLFLDQLLSAYALILTFCFAVILLLYALTPRLRGLGMILLCWVVLAYLALPRFHRLLSSMYLPDYFIARTKTSDGILGDPINIALIGKEEDIHALMRQANWAQADPITLRSTLGIIHSTLTRKSYPAAPVSSLYLFDRKQDFAYSKEVDGSSVKRHHVRFYKVPEGWVLPGGKKVDYLAAGTFDKGVGLSYPTLQFTHKIDENIDLERNYIIENMQYVDENASVEVLENFSSSFHDKNGGGDLIYTDGNMPIVDTTNAYQRAIDKGVDLHQIDTLTLSDTSKALTEELPPASLRSVSFLIGAKWIVEVVLVIVALSQEQHMLWTEDVVLAWIIQGIDILFLTIEMILSILTWRKNKWARLSLLVIAALESTLELSTLFMIGKEATFMDVLGVGLSVIFVLLLSSFDIRSWVYEVPRRGWKPSTKQATLKKDK